METDKTLELEKLVEEMELEVVEGQGCWDDCTSGGVVSPVAWLYW